MTPKEFVPHFRGYPSAPVYVIRADITGCVLAERIHCVALRLSTRLLPLLGNGWRHRRGALFVRSEVLTASGVSLSNQLRVNG